MSTRKSSRGSHRLSFAEETSPKLCSLCSTPNNQISTPSQWRSEPARTLAATWQVTSDSLVCKPCRDDISKCLANTTHTPRWKVNVDNTSITKCKCIISDCSKDMDHTCRLYSGDELKSLLAKSGLQCLSTNVPIPTPLHKHHYHIIYDAYQPRQTRCVTCDMPLSHTNARPCSQPKLIQKHLTENTDFECTINIEDKVCLTCYKSHIQTLQIKPQRILN